MSKFQEEEYSVYVGNLDLTVPLADMEELIYELFLQVPKLATFSSYRPEVARGIGYSDYYVLLLIYVTMYQQS